MQSSDKLIVEIFPEPEQQEDRVRSILEHLISPGQDVGGDSRLLIPSDKNVVTAEDQIAGQVSASYDYRLARIAVISHKCNVFPAVPIL